MDTVILAAGKGSRLGGIVAPYHKPLLVVNGQPMIVAAVRNAYSVPRRPDDRVVIVVAQENALPIAQVIDANSYNFHVDVILQPRQGMPGPGGALYQGLKLVQSDHVLVLMADNVTPQNEVAGIVGRVTSVDSNIVGVTHVPMISVERFTRYRVSSDEWVEKVPVTDDDADPEVPGMSTAWVGPLVLEAEAIKTVIEVDHFHCDNPNDEVPIGPLLNELKNVTMMYVSTLDIGIPEAL